MVLTGIDILIRDNFRLLNGRRIGLITNHTGLTRDGRSTIDVLHRAPGVELKALFGPEHGIRGELDAPVKDAVDSKTGLPVYSLYGETTRPKPEQLAGLDTLVYDIQDVGCRYYTYSSTLGIALEEAGKRGIRFVVLDRPNPITGIHVEGPIADADRLTFVAWHTVPVRHGMTMGEMAQLYNAERRIGADLGVVPCEGWKRGMWWDETGLTWTNPSPNMRSLTEATLYPAIGLIEFTNISVGRGTDTPFEVIGAPWIDGIRLASELNARGLSGVRFIPIRFTPRASRFQGESCGGVSILITERPRFRCLQTGMEIACALRRLFVRDWQIDAYDRLLVNRKVFAALKAGASPNELESLWKDDIARFEAIRGRYLLYRA